MSPKRTLNSMLITSVVLMLFLILATATLASSPDSGSSQPDLLQDRSCAIDLMLVFDSSNSISPEDFEIMKDFARDLVGSFILGPDDAQVGIIQFSSSVRLEIGLSDNSDDINAAIDDMTQLTQNTNITGAMHLAQEQFEAGRRSIRKVMIVFTDGEHNVGPGSIPEAESIRGEGASTRTTIFGVAVGDINLDELTGISGGENRVIQVPDFEGLTRVLSILHDYSCAVVVDGAPPPAATSSDESSDEDVETTIATPSLPEDSSEIVFVSDRTGGSQIYVMNGDGSNLRQLSYNSVGTGAPTWSPDGQRIAYEARFGANFAIFTMKSDGSDVQQVTVNEFNDWGPAWSPDGSQLAFHSDKDGGANIYVVSIDGANRRQITSNGAVNRSAAWAPDGQSIVYFSDVSGGREVYITNINTGDTQRLTDNSYYDGLPDWSTSGNRIVFASTRDDANPEIYSMSPDGSGVQRLTSNPAIDDDPVWSTDGLRVAFESERAGNFDIWVMNADGSDVQQLTTSPARDWSPDWIGATVVREREAVIAASTGPLPPAGPPITDAIPPKSTLEPGTRGAPGGESLANSLQAGEIDDNDTFDIYLQYRYAYHTQVRQSVHHIDVSERYVIRASTLDGLPVVGAEVAISDEIGSVVTLRTGSTGEVYFFPLAYPEHRYVGGFQVEVTKGEASNTVEISRETTDTRYDVTLETAPIENVQLDVLFLLDTTGSMSDEIEELRQNILSISQQLDLLPNDPDIRYGLVIYRDRGDTYVTRNYDFVSDVSTFQSTLRNVEANGGGDYQESVNEAIHEAVNNADWRGGDAVQVLILIADAPPHLDYASDYDYADEMLVAAENGITIYTVASSGLDAQGEYIFRQLAHYTGGHFVFLTYGGASQLSGGGDASTAGAENTYTVQYLDTLIVNLITSELEVVTTPR